MKYIAKKTLTLLLTLGIVSFLVFLAFSVIPGDPATTMLGTQATPEKIEALREELGLNTPFMVRYGEWLTSFLKGDMGISYSYRMPVKQMLGDKIPVTMALTFMAFTFTVIISIPMGIFAARHEDGRIGRGIYIINQILMAVPQFFLGILFTFLFGLVLRFFTPGGYVSYTQSMGGFIKYLIFPSLAIALPKSAMTIKLLRSSVKKEAGRDYARTAYSRGNNTKNVLYRHVLKNAMIPSVTFLGMILTDMVANSIIVEQVFSIPGIGRVLLTSISNRDYPVVMAVIVCVAAFVVAVNLLVDLLYLWIDPRMRIQ